MKNLWLCSLIPLLSIALAPVKSKSMHPAGTTSELTQFMKIVVGGYQAKINLLEYDSLTHTFKSLSTLTADSTGEQPSFIGFSPNGRFLFAVNEVSNFGGLNQTGSVSSFEIQTDGQIRHVSTGLTGPDPVSLAVSPDGKQLIVAEYTGGSWSRFSINSQGEFTSKKPVQVRKYQGSGPVKQRQDHSYIHQVVYNKAGDLVFFVDLGGDFVYVHRVDPVSGQVEDKVGHEIKIRQGSGPRHLSLVEKNKEYDIYLVTELSNELFTIRLTDHNGLESVIRQTIDTLPPRVIGRESFGAGEVMVSRDGRFVYCSNRQTNFSKPISDNSIVTLTRNLDTGLLNYGATSAPTWFPLTIGGKTPRHFSFSNDPDQSLMIVGCQQANTLLVLNRNPENGHLKLLSSTAVGSPTVQLFLPDKRHS